MNIVKALFLTLLSITAFSVQSKQINTSNNNIEMRRLLNPSGTGQAGGGTTVSASSSTSQATYTPPKPSFNFCNHRSSFLCRFNGITVIKGGLRERGSRERGRRKR